MKLGLQLHYDDPESAVELGLEAERLGYDCVWTSEAWGADAITVAAFLAARTEHVDIGTAIAQIPARTPALTAMTVATLDHLSNGRVRLGLGTSGPQVVEGWHGEAWGKPLAKTREYVEIVRSVLRRERLEHHGEHYSIPYDGPGSTGLGKPLKLLLRPLRSEVPVYLAALGPKNVELAVEIAEGWLPIFFSPERFAEVHGEHVAGANEGFDIAPLVPVVLLDDVQAGLDLLKPLLALYVGGMGAKGANFYNRLACRYGYEEEAARIQELYLGGEKLAAADAVPDALVDEVALVGPKERIAERLQRYEATPVTSLVVQARQPEALQAMAELLL